MASAQRTVFTPSSVDSLSATSDHGRYSFRSNTFAYAIMVVLLFRYEHMGGLLAFPGHAKKVSIIEYLITSSFLILPILYMSLFIGHYSKFGCFALGRIVPLTYGLGYTMLIITVVQAVYSLINACDSLTLLHLALSSNLPWMECRKSWGSDCIGLHEMDKCAQFDDENNDNCYKNITQLSTYKYRVYVLKQFSANKEGEEKVDRFWNKIDGKRLGYLLLCVVAAFFLADLSIIANNKVTAFIFLVYFFALVFFSVVNLIPLKNYDGVFDIFKVTELNLFDIQTWFGSISYFTTVINLATVGPILIGSYLPKNSMADLQAFIIWLGVMFLYLLGEFMTGIMRAALAAKLNTPRSNLDVFVDDALSVLYPHFYGSLHFSPSMVTCIYLSVIIITSLYRLKLLLAVCYHTLADTKPVIRAYRFYIRIFSCFFLMILAFPVCIIHLFKTYFLILSLVEECLTAVVLMIMCIAVLYMYGTQTLFDDHHFTYGNQPAIYFKITLLAAPVVLIAYGSVLFLKFNHMLMAVPGKAVYVALIISICLFPQIIGLLFIMTYYLKRQDMAHLLRCEENWGDPNPQTRKERIIYHPRKETNYFRRIEVCKQHKCLRHNKIHSSIVKSEEWLHKDAYKFAMFTNAYNRNIGLKAYDDSLSSNDSDIV